MLIVGVNQLMLIVVIQNDVRSQLVNVWLVKQPSLVGNVVCHSWSLEYLGTYVNLYYCVEYVIIQDDLDGYSSDDSDAPRRVSAATIKELQHIYNKTGNIKYAITHVARMANIKRTDHNTLKKLAAESSSAQLKLVKRAWEEGIQLTDRPNRIYDKMKLINTDQTNNKMMENLVDATKLPYSAAIFVRGACRVIVGRVNEVLFNLTIDGMDREQQLK